ncbi:MAG TPA: nucleotidyltransferase domain-containing protein [Steroidobacteraceae bacterium]|nr:nucleotidyltransferase domain-containing protein [Steroidobacteraceae bacterium]
MILHGPELPRNGPISLRPPESGLAGHIVASVLNYGTIVLNMRTSLGVPLVELLFGAYRRQVLSLLLLRPDESFYVREIARLTGAPAGPVHRELKALTEAGLLVRKASGNQVRYQASRDCPIYPELAGVFRKTAGLADVLREALSPAADEITAALVFGSVAQGKEKPTSDIDLLVIGSVSFENVVEATHAARERLGREVNPVVMSKDAFRAKQRGRDRFLSRVLKEPKIFVIGDASELGKLTEDRAA